MAEPNNIRSQFHEAALLKHPLLERIYLKTMVTVVDSSRFFEEYYSRDTMIERPNLGKCSTLPIVELLIEQVECSDVIVLNKADRPEADGLGTELQELVTGDYVGAGWQVPVIRTAASTGDGVDKLCEAINAYETYAKEENRLGARRKLQLEKEMRTRLRKR